MTKPNLDFSSMLFVPADAEGFLAKAGERGADALILDLEDAVARPAKAAARGNLAAFIERLKKNARLPVYVRVNKEPELLAGDLEAAVAAGCDGLLMPKVDTPAQVLQLDTDLRLLEAKHGRGVFGGTEQEADAARCLLEVFDSAAARGNGAVSHEGRMVDEPIAVRAHRFLDRRDALKARRATAREALQ